MPTGYTACIKEGAPFEDFVMGCARAMGALIMMRDEPSSAPIPERFETSSFYARKVDEVKKEIDRLDRMLLSEADVESELEYKNEIKRLRKYITDALELRAKYVDMRSKVRAWTPPTTEHNGFKDFMIQQLEGSIDFDCNTDYYQKKLNEFKLETGQEWLAKKQAKATQDLVFQTTEMEREIERTEERNAWLKALRNSLK